MGYQQMTPIQAQSLPAILAGADIIGEAKTGSGKTAVFVLGILNQIALKSFYAQALILCPTRELADQVAQSTRQLARCLPNCKILTLCGGTPMGPQLNSLKHGAHIIVGTPGRVEAHLRKGSLQLERLRCFVLDEADRMLDMGFSDSLNQIISCLPDKRQTLLFSATFPQAIASMSKRVCVNPQHIKPETTLQHQQIRQQFYHIGKIDRFDALSQLLLHFKPERSVIFCNTKSEAMALSEQLKTAGFIAAALQGDLEQKQRDQTLIKFSNLSLSILVATDVAARGLDIDELAYVFNYQIARDLSAHVHRIGRTGRANNQGIACTLFNEQEIDKKNKLENYLGYKCQVHILPDTVKQHNKPVKPPMSTLVINLGKKQKIRPGDIVGAITAAKTIYSTDLGKIHIKHAQSYIAVKADKINLAQQQLQQSKIKGKNCQVRQG